MDDVLVDFIQTLRRCGLRVSVSESLDGARASSLIGLSDRGAFKAALRASLVKRTKDIPLFDQIFDAYFTDKPSDIPLEEMFGHGLPQPGESGDDAYDEAMRQAVEEMGGLSELTKALLQGNVQIITAEMLQHMSPEQLSQLQSMLQRGQFVRIVLDKMGWERIQREIMQLIQQLQQQGDYETAQRVRERLWELQELFPKWVAREVNDAVEQHMKQFQTERPPAPQAHELQHKDFARYTDAEIEAMEETVDQMARRLREDWSRRAKQGGRRRLDVPRTLRSAMGTFGVPMELRFKQKRRNRLNLVVLCDVSSSVRNASRFMLQLVYSLQQQRGRVRSFVFIGDLD
ncbi:MAG: VWA domain-containing protein, partial [Chloroflexota bacterium]|nr:VWA domain-containing protein [Chloroflexota bacterium]